MFDVQENGDVVVAEDNISYTYWVSKGYVYCQPTAARVSGLKSATLRKRVLRKSTGGMVRSSREMLPALLAEVFDYELVWRKKR
jgi:hypothetical protein